MIRKIFLAFFTSHGELCPPYIWATILMLMLITTWILKLTKIVGTRISDTFLLGAMGFVVAWVGIYSWSKKNNNEDNIK